MSLDSNNDYCSYWTRRRSTSATPSEDFYSYHVALQHQFQFYQKIWYSWNWETVGQSQICTHNIVGGVGRRRGLSRLLYSDVAREWIINDTCLCVWNRRSRESKNRIQWTTLCTLIPSEASRETIWLLEYRNTKNEEAFDFIHEENNEYEKKIWLIKNLTGRKKQQRLLVGPFDQLSINL